MLDLTNLTRARDDFGFGPVDLTIHDEVLVVLGPSGSGKTTLLSLIAGVLTPDSGMIMLGGRSLLGRPPEERDTGLVFQNGALFPHMTARENVAYAAADDTAVDDLAAMLEVRDVLDRRPGALSGGERQRVAFARTLAANPDALLLDEPLSNLDTPTRRRLREELHDLFASLAIPIVYVTHDQRAAMALGDRVAVLRAGRVEQVATPTTVRERPESRFVARFTGNGNVFDATVTDAAAGQITLRETDVTLQTTAAGLEADAVTACIPPSHVQVRAEAEKAANAVPGTVSRWLNEGHEYRVTVTVAGGAASFIATVPPPVFERVGVETGTSVHVTVPPDAVHLLR